MKNFKQKFTFGLFILLIIPFFGYLLPVKAEEYVNGIDVSHWQGSINWNKVYGAGYRFAFCKASQGISYVDSTFTTNMDEGTNAGLYLGPYHYANPDSYTGTAEAAHFVSVIQQYMINGYLRPALDLEEGQNLGKTVLTNWVIDFMTYVEEHTGVEPIIYCNSYYALSFLDSRVTQYDLWIANWDVESPNTGVWNTWAFWQYKVSDAGFVPGISGRCDLDLYNGDLNSLQQNFVIGGTPNDRVVFNEHEYQLISTSKTWTEAKDDCEAMGGYLVTLNSEEENDFVNNLVGTNRIWIGFSDELNEGSWQWVTGESITFTNWRSGEPNDYGSGEDYAEMYTDGTWNDIGPPQFPSTTRYYVCEWEKEDDRVEYNGHEYKLIKEDKSWSDAKIDCEAQGGHLATITSEGENDFIKNLADSNKVWLGLSDEESEGTWKWITGEAVSYTNWYPGEPNDYGTGEDYVEMYIDGRWNDIGPPQFPSTTRYYVCEWEKEDDRVEYNGHEYKLITEEKSWSDAKIDCEAQGGHLATITSEGENDFIKNLADSNKVWLGLTDEVSEGTWEWITGEDVSYTNWYPGEPNNYGTGEDYVEMYIDGRWNDIGPPQFPSTTRYYICEWEKEYSNNIFSTEGSVGYAEYWWNKRNSHYYDYSNVGGDCANFVSQCLIAGGLTLWKGSNGNGGGLDGRGCLPSCDNLHLHLKNFQSVSYQRSVKSGSWDNELPLWVSPGTVLIYGTAGGDEWRHTVIVTGGNGNTATVSGHTTDENGWSWTAFSSFSVVHVYKPIGYTSTYCVVEITASNLNVRTGPSTSYNIITTIQSGEKYVSIEKDNGWHRIWLDDRSAWISGKYVNTYDISNFNCYKVIANTLNVRDGPSTDYNIVGRCNYGQCFVRDGINGKWFQVYYSSATYWVHSDYLDLMEDKDNITNYTVNTSLPIQISLIIIIFGIAAIGSSSFYIIKRRH
ncbi:MAG: lectin-like protein [Candidatus Hodarchaeota archaeon]